MSHLPILESFNSLSFWNRSSYEKSAIDCSVFKYSSCFIFIIIQSIHILISERKKLSQACGLYECMTLSRPYNTISGPRNNTFSFSYKSYYFELIVKKMDFYLNWLQNGTDSQPRYYWAQPLCFSPILLSIQP